MNYIQILFKKMNLIRQKLKLRVEQVFRVIRVVCRELSVGEIKLIFKCIEKKRGSA